MCCYPPPPTMLCLYFLYKSLITCVPSAFIWLVSSLCHPGIFFVLFPLLLRIASIQVSRKPVLCPSNGLRTFVDCSLLYPTDYLVFSAIQLRPEFNYLLRHPHLRCAFDIMTLMALAVIGMHLWLLKRAAYYISDGVHLYQALPMHSRLLRRRNSPSLP